MIKTNMNIFDKLNHNDIDRRHLPNMSDDTDAWIDPDTGEEHRNRRIESRRQHDVIKQAIQTNDKNFRVRPGNCATSLPIRDLPQPYQKKVMGWKLLWVFVVPPGVVLSLLAGEWIFALLFLTIINYALASQAFKQFNGFIKKYCYRSRAFVEFADRNNLFEYNSDQINSNSGKQPPKLSPRDDAHTLVRETLNIQNH